MMQPQQRPTGITILAVLAGIGGVLGLLGGLALLSIGGIWLIIGLFFIAAAALNLAFAYGAWTLQPWAWTLGIAAEGLSIILSIIYIIGGYSTVGSQIIGIIINAAIIYYLMTPEIKRAFGRA